MGARKTLEECFPGGAAAADALLPRIVEPQNIVHSVKALRQTTDSEYKASLISDLLQYSERLYAKRNKKKNHL